MAEVVRTNFATIFSILKIFSGHSCTDHSDDFTNTVEEWQRDKHQKTSHFVASHQRALFYFRQTLRGARGGSFGGFWVPSIV